jgi:MFS family permease
MSVNFLVCLSPSQIQYRVGLPLTPFPADYSTIIFSNVELDANLSSILSAVLNTLFFLGAIPAIFLIDSWGRRSLMLWSAVIMSILMAIFIAWCARTCLL